MPLASVHPIRGFHRALTLVLALLATAPGALAANVNWSGATDFNFETSSNWSAPPANDTTSDVAVFSGVSTANQPRLSVGRSVAGLLFATPAGGWTLSAATPSFALAVGSSGISTGGQTTGVNTVSANLTVAATQTWQIGTGGFLAITGSVSAGTPTTPLAGQLVVGAGSNTGQLTLDPEPGRNVSIYTAFSTGGGSAIQVNQRLQLGGATTGTHIVANTLGAGFRVGNTGVLSVVSGDWRTSDLGSNNSAAFSGTLNVSGGSLTTGGGRYLGQTNGAVGTTINVSGGRLAVAGAGNNVVNSGYLGLGVHGSATPTGTVAMNVSGGVVDVAVATGTQPGGVSAAAVALGGVANTTALLNQTGGTVRVGLTPAAHVITGAALATNTFINLSIGSQAAANPCAYTLSGGTLLVAGSIQGVAPAAAGTAFVQNFNFLGGTLTASVFNAANLGSSAAASASAGQVAACADVGTLVNRGGTLAPGGDETPGLMSVAGHYSSSSGSLAIDLSGASPATVFQASAGTHDVLSVSGVVALGGDLVVKVLPGFTPAPGQSFVFLSAAGGITGAFGNVAIGSRVVSSDGFHSFVLSRSGNTLALGDYAAVQSPVIVSTQAPSTLFSGDSLLIDLGVSSLLPVTYEWRKNGVLLAGATAARFFLPSTSPSDSGAYEVVARNAAGTVTRSFNVLVVAPAVTTSVVIDAGATRSFSAAPEASAWQWLLDGEPSGSAPTFAYTPTSKAVGTHWLRVVESYANGTRLTRSWLVRVRIPSVVGARVYYVSPTGLDTAAGTTPSAPFRTLEKARDTIRALTATQRSGGVTVYLRGGTHVRSSTFTLGSSDSGTATAPITYAAYPGETPIISGGKSLLASNFTPLAASEVSRVAPGIDSSRIWEADLVALGITRRGPFPSVFNEWQIHNVLAGGSAGLCELFYNGNRMFLSRYPNNNLADPKLTPNLAMDGVAAGADYVAPGGTATGYLNGAGSYTDSTGVATAVGGAFSYAPADASRVARWRTALTKGGVWLVGYWRVPWQINGAKVGLIDTGTKQVIGFVPNPSNANNSLVSNGIGDKYARPAGSKKEPWWAINLLEELDQPGEWCVDFSRNRLYFLMDQAGAPSDGSVVLSDLAAPLFQLSGSHVRIQGLSFQYGLGQGVQVLNGSQNLIVDCSFRNMGNFAVDLNNLGGGTLNGVVSCDMQDLASGGVIVRGGNNTSSPRVPTDNFVVNNRVKDYARVVRVYAAAVDVGYQFGKPAVGVRVAHNTTSGSPHVGMLWKDYDNLFEYNDISDYCQFSNDMGGIYTFATNYVSGTTIRYNHLHHSDHGEGVYFDADHINATVYGNLANLHTLASESRGYGFFDQAPGGTPTPGVPLTANSYDNISVNGRYGFQFYTVPGGTIERNLAYQNLSAGFRWNRVTAGTTSYTSAASTAATLASGPLLDAVTDPGFLDFANDDLRLRPDAPAFAAMPGFTPIPLEMAGVYNDEHRADAAVLSPFIVTGPAAAVGANTATFTAQLVYPQFDANATVRVYWGTNDGGTDASAWRNVALLGQPGSGHVSHTTAALAPGTRYFYRFHAVNAAGEHWSEQTNSTTTYPIVATPSGGSASASSAASPAALAFDGDAATAWQAAPGTTTGTLAYQFAGNTPVRVTLYSVTSAPDTPARDPKDWTFQGSSDGAVWTTLDVRSGVTFSARGQTLDFGFINNSSYAYYRLVVTANNGDASALQLAELRLWSPTVVADTVGPVITTPGDLSITGASTAGSNVYFEVSAIDAVSGNCPATVTPASGSFFPVGATTVTVTAADSAGNSSTASFTVNVLAPPLPAPWSLVQIQPYSGTAPGSVTINGASAFTLSGSGGASTGGVTGDMWTGNSDSFTFFAQPWSGDGVFTARLASLSSFDASAKAGIAFRETTATGSRYSAIYMIRSGGGAVWTQHKTAPGGSTTNVNFFTASSTGRGFPEWIRLVRQGDLFTTHLSDDGVSWTQLGVAQSNPMSGTTLSVGLVAAPRTGNADITASFDNISFLTPLQAWRSANFGSIAATGDASDTADPDGDSLNNLLEYAFGTLPTDPASVSIPYPSLSSLNLNSYLQLTFVRSRTDVTYTVEATSDLTPPVTWSAIATNPGTVSSTSPVTVTDSVNLSTATPPRRFLRLRVTTP